MRSPWRSVDRVAGARESGERLLPLLIGFLDSHPDLEHLSNQVQDGAKLDFFGLPEEPVDALRAVVLKTCPAGPLSSSSCEGFQPDVIQHYCSATGDPDAILATWLRSRAPLGVEVPITPTGVFPPVEGHLASAQQLETIASNPDGWRNYFVLGS